MGLLEEAGIRVPKYRLAETADQAYKIAASQGWNVYCSSDIYFHKIIFSKNSVTILLSRHKFLLVVEVKVHSILD